MSQRRSRRVRNTVDYAKIVKIEGFSDDESAQPQRYSSDSDEYREEVNNDAQEQESDVHMSDVDNEVGEQEGDEAPEGDFDDVVENTSRKSKPAKSSAGLTPLKRSSGPKLQSLIGGQPAPSSAGGRTESLKDRFISFHGRNNAKLVLAIMDRNAWGATVIAPSKELFSNLEGLEEALTPSHALRYSSQIMKPLSENALSKFIKPRASVRFAPAKDSELVELGLFHSVRIHDQTPSEEPDYILNSGGLVTTVQWAPNQKEDQYLAVGVWYGSQDEDHVVNDINDPEISAYAPMSYPSLVQIYRISKNPSSSTNGVQLALTLCNYYGRVTSLQWRPCLESSGNGIFAASFQDGKIRLFQVPLEYSGQQLPIHLEVKAPLREYEVESKITCVAWRTVNVIVAGTSDGFVAEFDISDETEDSVYPSFYAPIHSSLISAISTGFPDNQDFVFTTSTDGFNRVSDVRDIKRSMTISTRSKNYSPFAEYCPQLSSFVCLEDTFSCKITPIRKLDVIQAGTNVTKHDGTVVSGSTSFFHPFILSGGAEGSLRIGNSIRRISVTRRNTNLIYRQGILWQCEYSMKENVYRFIDVLRVEGIPKYQVVEKQVLYPPEAVITSVDWNNDISVAGWYAAGMSNGLIRIENLAAT